MSTKVLRSTKVLPATFTRIVLTPVGEKKLLDANQVDSDLSSTYDAVLALNEKSRPWIRLSVLDELKTASISLLTGAQNFASARRR